MRSLPLACALDRHRAALVACQRCSPLPGVRPVTCEAVHPRVMLVGQAPGRVEMDSRRPFSGRAGRTLFRWLVRAGVDEATVREHVYISAITRCFPGSHPSGRGDRVPSRGEQAACAGWLDDELRLIRPELIVPVGRLAIDRFLGRRPLDVLVGRAHDVEHAGGSSIAVPLPHPSGASSWIHAPGNVALLDRALALLTERLAAAGVIAPPSSGERSVA